MLEPSRRSVALVAFFWGAACSSSGQTASVTPAPQDSSVPPRSAPASRASTPAASDTGQRSTPTWISSDSAARQVTLSLETSVRPGSAAALINGYRNGEARIVVPVGWTIRWNWRNADTGSAHSLVVMVQREKIPLEGGRPAFSNAMTRMLTEGLGAGQTDQSTFQAEEAGWYWLLCGVPNHALNGEWIELRIDPDARMPGLVLKPPSPS